MKRRTISREKRGRVLEKTRGFCFYCGDPLVKGWHVDHMTPISNGGTDAMSNLVPACRECNVDKHGDTVEEYRIRKEAESQKIDNILVDLRLKERTIKGIGVTVFHDGSLQVFGSMERLPDRDLAIAQRMIDGKTLEEICGEEAHVC